MWSKIELRQYYKKNRQELSTEERLRLSQSISDLLIQLEHVKLAKNILLYSAIQNEVDLTSLYHYCHSNHKKVFFPKTYDEKIRFFEVNDISEMNKGRFGVLEPSELSTEFQNESGVILVPGVAFSKNRHRIGYGKGYYDRFLTAHENLYSIGVGYEFQMIEDFETDKFDVPLNLLVSELGER